MALHPNTKKLQEEREKKFQATSPLSGETQELLRNLYKKSKTEEASAPFVSPYAVYPEDKRNYEKYFGRVYNMAPNLEDVAAQRQSIANRWAKFPLRVGTKIASEAAQLPGYAVGLFDWASTGFKQEEIGRMVDNAWINGVQQVEEDFKQKNLPIYIPDRVKNGSLWDNITSASFWATEGADAVGFFAAMLIPGQALKAAKLGSKAARIFAKGSASFANKFDTLTAAAINTLYEAAAEGGETFREVERKTGDRQLAGAAAADVVQKNMMILLGPNILQQRWLFNGLRRFKQGASTTGKITKNRALRRLVDDKTGDLLADVAPKARWDKIATATKPFLTGIVSEGFFEEGMQFASSEAAKEKIEKGEEPTFINDIVNVLDTYTDKISDTEMQKSIFLGSVLGGIMGGVGGIRSNLQEERLLKGQKGKKPKALGKFFGKEERKPTQGLHSLLKQNYVNRLKTYKDLAKIEDGEAVTDENGQYVLDPTKVKEAGIRGVQEMIQKEQLRKSAENGDAESFYALKNSLDFDYMLPFLEQEGGLELLEKHIESLSKADAKEAEDNGYLIQNTAEIKNDLLDKARRYQKIVDKVDNTHKATIGIKPEKEYRDEFEAFSTRLKDSRMSSVVAQDHYLNRIEKLSDELAQTSKGKTAVPITSKESKISEKYVEGLKESLKSNRSKLSKAEVSDVNKKINSIDSLINAYKQTSDRINKELYNKTHLRKSWANKIKEVKEDKETADEAVESQKPGVKEMSPELRYIYDQTYSEEDIEVAGTPYTATHQGTLGITVRNEEGKKEEIEFQIDSPTSTGNIRLKKDKKTNNYLNKEGNVFFNGKQHDINFEKDVRVIKSADEVRADRQYEAALNSYDQRLNSLRSSITRIDERLDKGVEYLEDLRRRADELVNKEYNSLLKYNSILTRKGKARKQSVMVSRIAGKNVRRMYLTSKEISDEIRSANEAMKTLQQIKENRENELVGVNVEMEKLKKEGEVDLKVLAEEQETLTFRGQQTNRTIEHYGKIIDEHDRYLSKLNGLLKGYHTTAANILGIKPQLDQIYANNQLDPDAQLQAATNLIAQEMASAGELTNEEYESLYNLSTNIDNVQNKINATEEFISSTENQIAELESHVKDLRKTFLNNITKLRELSKSYKNLLADMGAITEQVSSDMKDKMSPEDKFERMREDEDWYIKYEEDPHHIFNNTLDDWLVTQGQQRYAKDIPDVARWYVFVSNLAHADHNSKYKLKTVTLNSVAKLDKDHIIRRRLKFFTGTEDGQPVFKTYDEIETDEELKQAEDDIKLLVLDAKKNQFVQADERGNISGNKKKDHIFFTSMASDEMLTANNKPRFSARKWVNAKIDAAKKDGTKITEDLRDKFEEQAERKLEDRLKEYRALREDIKENDRVLDFKISGINSGLKVKEGQVNEISPTKATDKPARALYFRMPTPKESNNYQLTETHLSGVGHTVRSGFLYLAHQNRYELVKPKKLSDTESVDEVLDLIKYVMEGREDSEAVAEYLEDILNFNNSDNGFRLLFRKSVKGKIVGLVFRDTVLSKEDIVDNKLSGLKEFLADKYWNFDSKVATKVTDAYTSYKVGPKGKLTETTWSAKEGGYKAFLFSGKKGSPAKGTVNIKSPAKGDNYTKAQDPQYLNQTISLVRPEQDKPTKSRRPVSETGEVPAGIKAKLAAKKAEKKKTKGKGIRAQAEEAVANQKKSEKPKRSRIAEQAGRAIANQEKTKKTEQPKSWAEQTQETFAAKKKEENKGTIPRFGHSINDLIELGVPEDVMDLKKFGENLDKAIGAGVKYYNEKIAKQKEAPEEEDTAEAKEVPKNKPKEVSNFNPTKVEETKRKEYAKYVTKAHGEIASITPVEEKAILAKGYDYKNRKYKTLYSYNVKFKSGREATVVPEEGSIRGVPADVADIKIFIGLNYLIENSKLEPVLQPKQEAPKVTPWEELPEEIKEQYISRYSTEEKARSMYESTTKRTSRERTATREVQAWELEDVAEARKWFKKRFPDFPLEVVDELIDNKSWGRLERGSRVLLSRLAEHGTIYHEGFHVVSQIFMDSMERTSLYSEARERLGKPKLTDGEVEEILAEEFREFMLSPENYTFSPKEEVQKTWFNKLLDYIKQVVGNMIGLSREETNEKSIEQLFEGIKGGTFHLSKDRVSYTDKTLDKIADLNNRDSLELLKDFNHKFFGNFVNIDNLEDSNILDFKEANLQKLYKDMKFHFTIARTYPEHSFYSELSEEYDVLFNKDDTINEDVWDDIIKDHVRYLRQYQINASFKKPEDVPKPFVEEDDKVRDTTDYRESSLVNPAKDLPDAIKLLVASLELTDNTGNPKLKSTVNYNRYINALNNRLAGVTTMEEMVSKLREIQVDYPALEELIETIGLNNKSSLNNTQIELQNQLFKTFSNNKNRPQLTVIDAQGRRYVLNAVHEVDERVTYLKWKNNAFDIVEESTEETPFLKRGSKGNVGIKVQPLLEQLRQEIAIPNDWNRLEALLDTLSLIGVDVARDPEQVGDATPIENYTKRLVEELEAQENDFLNINELFNRDVVQNQKEARELVEKASEILVNDEELVFTNQEGNQEWSITVPSHLSNVINAINKLHLDEDGNEVVPPEIAHLKPFDGKEGSLFSSNSQLWDSILGGNKAELVLVKGHSLPAGVGGTSINKGTPGEYKSVLFNHILNNTIPLLRAGDRKTEFAIKFKTTNPKVTTTKIVSDMKKYLRDELLTSFALRLKPESFGGNLKYYKDKAKNLRTFSFLPDNIIDKFLETKVDLNKLEEDFAKMSVEKTLEPLNDLVDNFLDVNEDVIDKSIKKYIDKSVDNTLESLEEDKILIRTKTNLGKTQFIAPGLDTEHINRYGIEANQSLTEDQVRKMIKVANYNYFVGTQEQLKFFVGDIANFKNSNTFFQRVKGINSTKRNHRNDSELISLMNERWPQLFGQHEDVIAKTVLQDLDGSNEVYGNIKEITDAQSWITLDAIRSFLIRNGEWGNKEKTYQWQMQKFLADVLLDERYAKYKKILGIDQSIFTSEDSIFFEHTKGEIPTRPMWKGRELKESELEPVSIKKPMGYGSIPGQRLNATSYWKTAMAPIFIADLSPDNPYLEVAVRMMKDNIGILNFESSEKNTVRTVDGEVPQLFRKDGKVRAGSISRKNSQLMRWSDFGEQVVVHDEPKGKVTKSSQRTMFEFVDLFDKGKLAKKDKNIEKIYDEYSNLLNNIVRFKREELLEELGLEQTEDGYELVDSESFKEGLLVAMEHRLLPRNLLDGVDYALDSSTKVLDTIVHKDKIEEILLAMVRNKIFPGKTNGELLVQESSALHNEDLKFYRKDKDGKVLPMEVMIPLPKELEPWVEKIGGLDILNKLMAEGNTSTLGEDFSKIFKISGVRMPAHGLNSMEAMTVKKFLPSYHGPKIVLPEGITVKTGSDFDVDKMVVYYNSFGDDEIDRPKYTEDAASIETLENKYNELLFNLTLHPERFDELIKPTDADTIRRYSEDIAKSKGRSVLLEPELSEITQLSVNFAKARQYFSGSAGIAFVSVNSTAHATSQKYPTKMHPIVPGGHIFFDGQQLEEDETYTDGHIKDSGGHNTSTNMSEFMTGFVDIVKDAFVFNIADDQTFGTYAMLNRFGKDGGVDVEAISYFMTQDIIERFKKEELSNKSAFLKLNSYDRESAKPKYKDKIFNVLIRKLKEELPESKRKGKYPITYNQTIASSVEKLLNSNPGTSVHAEALNEIKAKQKQYKYKHFTKEQLKKGNFNMKDQIQLLDNYIMYDQLKWSLVKLNSLLRPNTNSQAPKHLTDVQIRADQLYRLEDSDLFDKESIDAALGRNSDSFLGEFHQAQIASFDAFGNLFFTKRNIVARKYLYDFIHDMNEPGRFIRKQDKQNRIKEFDNKMVVYILYPMLGDTKDTHATLKRVFMGANSAAHDLRRLKSDPKYRDNDAIKLLEPIIQEFIRSEGRPSEIDNIMMGGRGKNVFDMDAVTAGIQELYDNPETREFAKKLATIALFQSGLSTSPISFLEVVPNEIFTPSANKQLERFDKDLDTTNQAIYLQGFPDVFYRNMAQNPKVVSTARYPQPLHKASKSMSSRKIREKYQSRRTYLVDNKTKKEKIANNERVPTRRMLLIRAEINPDEFTDKEVDFYPHPMLGDGMRLFEATPLNPDTPSILKINNLESYGQVKKSEKTKVTKGTEVTPTTRRAYTPEKVTKLRENEVFVFGSNKKGLHGKGAALQAKRSFGAKQGQAEGLQGQSYAVVTKKNWRVKKSSTLSEIQDGLEEMLDFAEQHPKKTFLVTKLGTANAGYTVSQIRRLFYNLRAQIPENVVLPREFEVRDTYEDKKSPTGIQFKQSTQSGYKARTRSNASADATIAIAANFNSAGEKLTKRSVLSQGKKYIPLDISQELPPYNVLGDKIIEELNTLDKSSISLNIAGNGIYTFANKYTQAELDKYVYDVLDYIYENPYLVSDTRSVMTDIRSVVTGGQTGIDEAGAKAAARLGISTKILAPKGWKFRNKQGEDISSERLFKKRFAKITETKDRDRESPEEQEGDRYALESDAFLPEDDRLNELAEKFLSTIGVPVRTVDAITNHKGIVSDAVAVANTVNSTVDLVKGRGSRTNLPEEAAHWYVKLLGKDHAAYKGMMSNIHKYKVFDEVVEKYSDVYEGDMTKIKEEAVGQLISRHMFNERANEDLLDTSQKKQTKTWWNSIWNTIKRIFGKVNTNDYIRSAHNIMNQRLDDLRQDSTEVEVGDMYAAEESWDDIHADKVLGNLKVKYYRTVSPAESTAERYKEIFGENNVALTKTPYDSQFKAKLSIKKPIEPTDSTTNKLRKETIAEQNNAEYKKEPKVKPTKSRTEQITIKKLQNKLQKLYPEIKLNITNNPIWEKGDDILNQEEYKDQVNFRLKVVNALLNLIKPKETKRSVKYGEQASPERLTIRTNTKDRPYIEANLRKKLRGSGVLDTQIDFIFEYMKSNNINSISTKDLVLELANNYSHVVKVNVSESTTSQFSEKEKAEERLYDLNAIGFVFDRDLTDEEKEEKEEIEEKLKNNQYSAKRPTTYYSKVTVPGGTNYAENEIITPAIEPFIKGHPAFATTKGIGWFRSDEQKSGIMGGEPVYEEGPFGEQMLVDSTEGDIGSKIRRILEIQSDLFQKRRDEKDLVYINTNRVGEKVAKTDTHEYIFKDDGIYARELGSSLFPQLVPKDQEHLVKVAIGDYIKQQKSRIRQNQFLQLLNKDSKWIKFFVQSIVQDSAKKGYEKVLFPSGGTAADVQGHTTIANRIKEINNDINSLRDAKLNPERYSSIRRFPKVKRSSKIGEKRDKSISHDKFSSYKVYSVELSGGKGIFVRDKNRFVPKIDKKIAEYREQRHEFKTQGIEKLRPIEGFYEIKVNNVLKKLYGKENIKTVTDEHGNKWRRLIINPVRDLDNILLQRNEANRIIGQANIKAGKVLIDAVNQKVDTLPHEYAHHYIAWYRNTPIVQEAIKKWGSEEALVQSIGEQAVKQNGEAWNWWSKFVKWILGKFNNLSSLDKQELTQVLTDAFLTRQSLTESGEFIKTDNTIKGDPFIEKILNNFEQYFPDKTWMNEIERRSLIQGTSTGDIQLKCGF